jgi:rhodanese-related sulfurtransferase
MSRRILINIFILLSFAGGVHAYQDISAESLEALLTLKSNIYLCDVRELNEYTVRHIPGVALYPWNSGVFVKRWTRLPDGIPIVLVCKSGARSQSAAEYLEAAAPARFAGRLYRLVGGTDAWPYEVVLNDLALFPRQKVLGELTTATWCSYCFYSNKYIDERLLPALPNDVQMTLIRYHVTDIFLPTPVTRLSYYNAGLPDFFINGSQEIYPDERLTASMITAAARDSSTMKIDLQGGMPAADDSALVKVTITASSRVDTLTYNVFFVLTESAIFPELWTPPYVAENGQKQFDQVMREMILGESGLPITLQPGEKVVLQRRIYVSPQWNPFLCEFSAFVQNLKTRKVQQTNSSRLNELKLDNGVVNHPPLVRLKTSQTSYSVNERDTLRITAEPFDPDPGDKVTLSLRYSADGSVYSTQLPANVYLQDSIFSFRPADGQAGLYRFMAIAADLKGLTDTVTFNVQVNPRPAQPKKCDCNGDSKVSLSDLIYFLLLARRNPLDPQVDWNGDGRYTLADAEAFLMDLVRGNCPDVLKTLLAASGAGSAAADETRLGREEADYVEQALARLPLTGEQKTELASELAAMADPQRLPKAFALEQNVPNPFNPSTTVCFSIPTSGQAETVSLKIYDLRGNLVRTLVQGIREPGIHTTFWDGTDESGRRVQSGVYLYRLQNGREAKIRKMVLLK